MVPGSQADHAHAEARERPRSRHGHSHAGIRSVIRSRLIAAAWVQELLAMV